MRILFTGASSLAGAEWARQLQQAGHEITAVSRRALPDLPTVTADLANEGAEALLPDQQFDALVHFASYVPPNEPASTWDECAPTNISGTVRVLRWAEGRVRRIVLASSCAIYGARKLYTPTDEQHPLAPDTQYALTKYAQEQLVHAFCVSRHIPHVCMRLGYVYGPGMPEGRAIVKLLRMLLAQQPITLVNAPTAGLHLIHTQDIARIGTHLLRQGAGAYNIVGAGHVSLRDYVQTAMEVTGCHSEIVERNDPQASATNWYAIRRLLAEGIQPEVSLQEGIASLMERMQQEGTV